MAFWHLCFVIFPAIAILHLHVSPYTKVEESFNIQAVHDILEYGVPMSNATSKLVQHFDHMTFPGAVRRTFIGSLILAGLSKPEIWLGNLHGIAAQTHVRAVLGGINATAMALFARSVERAYGPIAATWYVVLQASQFHVWYYASRTLPNMFAFCLSTAGLAFLLPNITSSLGPMRRIRLGLYLITISTVIFRSELALLLGAHCLWLLLKPQTLDAKLKLIKSTLIPAIVPGAVLALLLTVTIDSYLWRSPDLLWPELSAFLSNVFPKQGDLGASAWGTKPFYWYLVSALPRLLMNQVAMVDLFFSSSLTLNDFRVLDNLIPSYAYLLLYSILPHKEIRFMFPIVPSLTLVAALTCTRLTINAHKGAMTKSLLYAAAASTLITAFVSHAVLLPLSAQNYPGGNALQTLHRFYQIDLQKTMFEHRNSRMPAEVHVHLTNLALQSGVTRFLEQPLSSTFTTDESMYLRVTTTENDYGEELEPIILPGDSNHPALTIKPKAPMPSSVIHGASSEDILWVYDKTSNSTALLESSFWDHFDFAIVENPLTTLGSWEVIQEIKAIGRPTILSPHDQQHFRYRMSDGWTTPDELWTYWTTPDDLDIEGSTTGLLHMMYPSFISSPLAKIHNLAHDILRLGRWSPIGSITRGYWFEIPLTTKLYILRQGTAGTPQHGNSKPITLQTSVQSSTGTAVVNGLEETHNLELPDTATTDHKLFSFDKLGPMVVNKDGTLSRIDNWQQMTEQERIKTIKYLKKRNMLRLEQAEAAAV